LEGLFQGLQTALVAQHISARISEQGTKAIPKSPGVAAPTMGTGMYL